MDSEKQSLTLATRLRHLAGMGPARAERLQKLGLETAGDLLFFFPRDYQHPAPPAKIHELREGQPASIFGTITDAEIASRTPGKSVFGAIVEDGGGAARLLFFNQPFRAEQLTIDRRVLVSGTPKLNGLRMEFVHPQVTLLDQEETPPIANILPIYSLTEGIKQGEMRRWTSRLVDELAGTLTEVLPESLRRGAADELRHTGIPLESPLPSIDTALAGLHCPIDSQQLAAARTRFVFQELLVMQLALAIRRRQLTTDLHAPPLAPSARIDTRIINRFPFELTGDQRSAIQQVGRDMSRQFPMNRLLQGDVGSGKTVVAVYAMLLAVAHKHQAVMMAPTEVLARQHHQTLSRTLAESRVRVGLLCGSLTAAQRRDVLAATSAGEIDVLVGTQSLLHEGVQFARLGLCVIDEQHKFGVRQRVTLRSGGVDPHCLVMSATPIPRSIAMTLFGDVELSTLREKPPGRRFANTYLAHDGWRDRWWSFLRDRLDEGRQAFVVAPRVGMRTEAANEDEPNEDKPNKPEPNDETTSEDVSSVEQVYESLCSGPLSGYRVGLLHGRLAHDQKRAIMQSFAGGELQVLVTTTVIEVGIDVPNATVMTILGADRFGLAQLHQLRGRVSRGVHAGHVCVLTDGEGDPRDNERLRVFEQTEDGFELAEADFRLRGPGDLLGRRQSGLPPLRIADLGRDQPILQVARELAQTMVDQDPHLEAAELAELRHQVLRRYGQRLQLGDVA